MPGPSRRPLLRACLAALFVFGCSVVVDVVEPVASQPAHAAAGSPGVPAAPTVIYREDFENNVDTAPVKLQNYVGANGSTYTADPAWLKNCNGVVLSFNSPSSAAGGADCSTTNFSSVRGFAQALGSLRDPATANSNHAIAAYTAADPGADKVMFKTTKPIPLTGAKRFITFSVDATQGPCSASHAQLKFYLLDGTTEVPTFSTPIDPCQRKTSGTVVGTFAGNKAILFNGQSMGIVMRNGNGSGVGNDAAFDNIQALDVTPQLDKSFSPTNLLQGGTSTLTFTITNTSELAEKDGWSFTDTFPAGLTVAAGSASTTCSSGVVTAVSGAGTVTATGNLDAGQASCTVTVPVTSAVAATYTNGASNLALTGLGAPLDATVAFTPIVDLAVTKSVSANPFVPGMPLSYTVTVTNLGPSAAVHAKVDDSLPAALSGFTWTCVASAGGACAASGSGDIHDDVTVPVGGTATYTVTGTAPPALTGAVTNKATVTPPAGTTDTACTPSCSSSVVTVAAPRTAMSITKRADRARYTPGAGLTYTVTVANAGPSLLVGARVLDHLPAELAGFAWSCSATAGSACAASGSGDIDDTVSVAPGGSLTYTVTGTVPPGISGTLSNAASVTVAATVPDANCKPTCSASVNNDADVHTAFSISKTVSSPSFTPGAPLSFVVTVANAGPSDAVNALVADKFPASLAGFGWTCAASAGSACTASGNGDINDLVKVAVGGKLTYTITGTTASSVVDPITNSASVTPPAGVTDSTCAPSCSASATAKPELHTSLAIKKSANLATYTPGLPLTYTVTVANGGPSMAHSVAVADQLPAPLAGAGFAWTCAASAGSQCGSNGAGDIADTATIDAGGAVTYTLSGVVPADATGVLTNTATATAAANTDANCTPTCSASVHIDGAAHTALIVTKTVAEQPYTPGGPITYTVIVSNAGPSVAAGVAVSDPVPALLTGAAWNCAASLGSACGSAGAGDVSDVAMIAVGGTVAYTIHAMAPEDARVDITNVATVTPPAGTEDPGCTPSCAATAVTSAQPRTALSITKTADSVTYTPGMPISYTVTVANTGPSAAIGADVADQLPPDLQAAGFSWTCEASSASSCAPSGSGDIDDAVTVAVGGLLTYTVTGTVPPDASGTLTNAATVTADKTALDTNCTPTCAASVSTDADVHTALAVTKTVSTDKYVPGTPLTFTVVVSNAGPSTARDVSVSDPLPSELAGFTWTCAASPGSTCPATGSGGVTDTPTIAAQGSVTYTITGIVPPDMTGTIVNLVSVTPPADDTDPGCTPNCTAVASATPEPHTSLAIAKTVDASTYRPGQAITYTITVTNAGPSDAIDALFDDPLVTALKSFTWRCMPSAGSTCTASGAGSIHDTVTVAAGGSLTYSLTGSVTAAAHGRLTNVASVTANGSDVESSCATGCSGTASLAERAEPIPLASTGTPVVPLISAALGALILGCVLVASTRPRRRHRVA